MRVPQRLTLLSLLAAAVAADTTYEVAREISLVIEPFEDTTLLSTDSGVVPEVTDGVVRNSVGIHLNTTTFIGMEVDSFGPSYQCLGATHLTMWYKLVSNTPMTSSVDLAIELGDRICNDCNGTATFDLYTSPTVTLESSEGDEWRSLSIDLDTALWVRSTPNSNSADVLDLNYLKSWKVLLQSSARSGFLLLDNLACVGDGLLWGNAWTENFEDSIMTGNLDIEFLGGIQSEANTVVSIDADSKSLDWNWTVEHTHPWGGLISIGDYVAGNGFYNLSKANSIRFDFLNVRPSSLPESTHLRVVIREISECIQNCSVNDVEAYYNFNFVLDEEPGGDVRSITIPLQGDEDADSAFYRPGWLGIEGDGILDATYIKGVNFEIHVGPQFTQIGDTVTGRFIISQLQAGVDFSDNAITNSTMIQEEGVVFAVRAGGEVESHLFKGRVCRQLCEEDPGCLYAARPSDNRHDCLLVSNSLNPEHIQLVNNAESSEASAYWKNDPGIRGDFCERCSCDSSAELINCRGRNLFILPATFNENFSPRVLDLSENPQLVFIGVKSFESWADSLEALVLPRNLVYMEPSNLSNLTELQSVQLEDDEQSDGPQLSNYILNSPGLFNEVCCSRGLEMSGLTFCEVDLPCVGDDTLYDPFQFYSGTEEVASYRMSSAFFADTIESPEKCAEACAVTEACRYFRYDARDTNDINCVLMKSGIELQITDYQGQYRDEGRTLPAVVSGWSPIQRFQAGDARVFVTQSQLVAQESNGYSSTIEFFLKTNPLRGGVWVTPSVSAASGARVSFVPPKIALYDDVTPAVIQVTVVDPRSETLLISANIESCDEAYVGGDTDEGDFDLVLDVQTQVDSSDPATIAGVTVGVGAVVAACVLYLYLTRKKRQNDNLWMVKMSSLQFDDPPRVAGRGAFGVVLLAEYRGTRVAVKKVHPSRDSSTKAPKNRSGSESGTSSTHSSPLPVIAPSAVPQESGFMSGGLSGWIKNARANQRKMAKIKSDFIREMRQLAKLRHPCVTTIMGAVVENTCDPMLIMEYMEYGSLHSVLRNDSIVVDGEFILPIFQDIAQGVRFLHSADPEVIHGDLKAANILVDANFRAKVSDFGLSNRKDSHTVGTPYWMAPELIRGEARNNPATDVYAFGMIVYEVYMRKDPYEGERSDQVLRLVADSNENKRPPVPECCPPVAKSLMEGCLRGDPILRPSFEEVDEGLKTRSAADLQPLDVEDERTLISSRSAKISKELIAGNRSEQLLREVFPQNFADRVSDNRSIQPMRIDCATVVCCHVSYLSESLPKEKLIDLLDRLETKLLKLFREHNVFHVETNDGSSFLGVASIAENNPVHSNTATNLCLAAIKGSKEILVDPENPSSDHVHLKCGIHTGPLTASVVGTRCPRFCLFGDTVLISHRLAKSSLKDRIQSTEASVAKLTESYLYNALRGTPHALPGHSVLDTYWIELVKEEKN